MQRESKTAGIFVMFTLMVGCRSAVPVSTPPESVAQLCTVTIVARSNRFIFVNPNGVQTIRTVGSLDEAITLRSAGDETATLRVFPASRWRTGMEYPLEWGVPQTIWSSVKQPKGSPEARVHAGRYQAVFRYMSPGNDRFVCEAVSAPVDLPEFLVLTTD